MAIPAGADTATPERLIPTPQPGVLLLLSTFAAVPYMHLQLESRRRFYPDVPVIVHDDASPFTAHLQDLCVSYGANFFSPRERYRQQCGDLSAILLAIESAQSLGCELAVKMSRRFIPLTNWVPQLQYIAYETQYPTYTHWDEGHGLGFRSECVAFHAPTWTAGDYCKRIEAAVEAGRETFGIVEAYVHNLAREIHHRTPCAVNRAYERLFPREPDTNGYGVWTWLGSDRRRRCPSFLWHDADGPLDYFRLSQAYGLTYRYEDFADPNMGCGPGPA